MAGVIVKIGGDSSELESAVRDSKKSLSELSSSMREGVNVAAKYAAGMAAAGAAIAAGLTVKGLKAVDSQAKLARQLGATNDGLRGLQIAAQDAGISSGALSSAMSILNARIGEAQQGTGTAAAAFERLGIDVNRIATLDADERMAMIADRMRELGLSTQQAAFELRQMGIRSGEMVNLLVSGGDAIRAARQEVDDLGLSLSDIDAAKVEMANDAFARFGLILESISQRLAIEVAPILTAVSRMFSDAAKEAGGMGEMTSASFEAIVNGAAFAIDAVRGLEVVAKSIIVAFQAVGVAIIGTFGKIIEGYTHLANLIPGINIDYADTAFGRLETGVRQGLTNAVQELRDLVQEPMPGESFKRFVAEAKEAAEQAAMEMVSLQDMLIGRPETFNEKLEEIVFNMEDYQKRMTDLEQEGADARNAIVEQELLTKRQIIGNSLSDLSTLMNTESKKLFQIGKTAAIANSIISTYEGMSAALKLGWPMGPIAAAAIGAKGFAQVAAIRRQSLNSPSPGAVATGSATAAVNAASTPVQAPTREQVFTVQGLDPNQIFTGSTMRGLLSAIEEAAGDGRTRIVLA